MPWSSSEVAGTILMQHGQHLGHQLRIIGMARFEQVPLRGFIRQRQRILEQGLQQLPACGVHARLLRAPQRLRESSFGHAPVAHQCGFGDLQQCRRFATSMPPKKRHSIMRACRGALCASSSSAASSDPAAPLRKPRPGCTRFIEGDEVRVLATALQ